MAVTWCSAASGPTGVSYALTLFDYHLTSIDLGYVHGSTLTLPRELSIVLGAFLALFVKLAGSYLWGIICFTIHQINVSSRVQDNIYH